MRTTTSRCVRRCCAKKTIRRHALSKHRPKGPIYMYHNDNKRTNEQTKKRTGNKTQKVLVSYTEENECNPIKRFCYQSSSPCYIFIDTTTVQNTACSSFYLPRDHPNRTVREIHHAQMPQAQAPKQPETAARRRGRMHGVRARVEVRAQVQAVLTRFGIIDLFQFMLAEDKQKRYMTT